MSSNGSKMPVWLDLALLIIYCAIAGIVHRIADWSSHNNRHFFAFLLDLAIFISALIVIGALNVNDRWRERIKPCVVRLLAMRYVVLYWVEICAKLCTYILSFAALFSLCAVIADLEHNFFRALLWLALLALFIGAVTVCDSIATRVHKWRERIKPCPHGVSAGAAGACKECQLAKERKEQEDRASLAEWQRKAEIQRQANELRIQEIQRLSHAWLSRSETYYSMTPQQFEDAIAQLFRTLKYEVKQTPPSNDGGKDAILFKDGKKYLVECKRYNSDNSIGRPDIQKFVAAMHDEEAVGGFYVNTGKFSSGAKKYADEHDILLYDAFTFPTLVLQAYPIPEELTSAKTMCLECGAVVDVMVADRTAATICPKGHNVRNTIRKSDLMITSNGTPNCEKCGSPMRVRKGYRGSFWGCSRYPECRFTRKISDDFRSRKITAS
ncbi:MAG: restriction endonuclease [Terracidiphilus sp.]|jgi:ssDNA-binding Zn-finger/Zn-ribbon topoisomerase 1